ncbi:MAG: hypothetical protein AMXMBFR57_35900 [Acidimicrobiia bacterium]
MWGRVRLPWGRPSGLPRHVGQVSRPATYNRTVLRLTLAFVSALALTAAHAFAQPAVVVEAGYQHETGLGRSGSFHGGSAALVVPLRGAVAPVIKVSVVKRHQQFARFEVNEAVVSLGVGGRVLLGRGTVRPWLQGLVGVIVDNYDSRSSDTGFFSDLGGGVTVDVTSRAGVYLSAGWRPTGLGSVHSGSHVSVGVSLGLGGR